ncbi:MAG: CopG family transcriptional regulator [Verrucomicrobiia bacterium]
MRTTLTLDPDVAERVRQEIASGKRSLKEVINEALRRGLAGSRRAPRRLFRVTPHTSPYHPGVDRGKLNHVLDELEAEAFHRKRSTS